MPLISENCVLGWYRTGAVAKQFEYRSAITKPTYETSKINFPTIVKNK